MFFRNRFSGWVHATSFVTHLHRGVLLNLHEDNSQFLVDSMGCVWSFSTSLLIDDEDGYSLEILSLMLALIFMLRVVHLA